MRTFFLPCFIAVGSLALQAHAVPLPDDEIMVGVYDPLYSTIYNEVNTPEEITEDTTLYDAIYYGINGKNESETNEDNVNITEVEAIVTKIISAMNSPMSLTNLIVNAIEDRETNVSSSKVDDMGTFTNSTEDESEINGIDIDSSEIDEMVKNLMNSLNLTNLFGELMVDVSKINETDYIGNDSDKIEDALDIYGINLNSSEIENMVSKIVNSMDLSKLLAYLTDDSSEANETNPTNATNLPTLFIDAPSETNFDSSEIHDQSIKNIMDTFKSPKSLATQSKET